ncbi:aldolase [Limnohabitans sp.]|uniref:class II aldolase/adducin family protein n=1 Tax=Limnohabitans sp. TaxID=1907725 RepID=UPI00286F92D4|nr:aldolase [Limnohabitans sp.]
MNELASRQEICRIGASLYACGYVHASAGNISVKLEDGSFLITPTDACLGHLVASELAHVSAEGAQLSGAHASKTLTLHRSIYVAAPHARCVIHTHATHLVSLTLQGVWHKADIVPPITPYYVMKVGHVPLVAYQRPGAAAVATEVTAHIRNSTAQQKPIRAVMLERLGPVVWHQTPAEASAVLEELEETAKLWLMSDRQASALTQAQIDELRETFHALW